MIEQAVALAQERNPEILIAHKKVTAARGGLLKPARDISRR
jgi:hypothetical protein